MKISNIINDLKFGELRHFNLGESDPEGVHPIHHVMITNLINQGIQDIYSRVPLLFKQIFIQPRTATTIYPLQSKYAITSTSSTVYKFILDSVEEKFVGNVLSIMGVYNEAGCELPLNDSNKCNSVFTVGLDTLQIPRPSDTEPLAVLYRTFPEELDETGDITQEVELPAPYRQALIMFIVAKCHLSRAHMDSEMKEQSYLAKYYAEIELQKSQGHFISDATSCIRLGKRGFA